MLLEKKNTHSLTVEREVQHASTQYLILGKDVRKPSAILLVSDSATDQQQF